MNLSTKALVIIIILMLVLITLSSFFLFSSGQEISRADAQRIFAERCNAYSTEGCDWELTKQDGFDEYITACRRLNGEYREAYSCLYLICNACKAITNDVFCEGQCEMARGMTRTGAGAAAACSDFAARCSTRCDACSGFV